MIYIDYCQTSAKTKDVKSNAWPRLKKAKHNNGTFAWLVDCRIRGTGERLFFKTKAEAETVAQQKRIARENEGMAGISVPEKLRIETLDCVKLLEPFGVSLRDAVGYFVKHSRPESGLKKLRAVRDEFLEAKADANRRAEYLRVQRCVLGKFCQTFGERNANEVRPDEIAEWLKGHGWSQRTRKNYHSDLSNFFGFAIRKGYCASNPMMRLEKPSVDEAPAPEIFTPSEAAALLEASERLGGNMTPFFAIGLFAGLRTTELLKLDWRNVDLKAKTIEVSSVVSKTREHRYVTISDNLAAWLRAHAHEKGPVKPAAWRWHRDAARNAAGLKKWPDNGMRHSFGSYHFARHSNAALTASEMGHRGNTQTLFAHYRALVKPKDAQRYWEITPAGKSRKIVAFAKAVA